MSLIPKNINERYYLVDKFSKVRKSFFSLNSFGIKPGGLNPFLQAFIYNTYCLSKITYGLEIMSINKKTINTMNVMQNKLIRYLLQLSSFNHLSSIHQALKILNFKHLIFKYKLCFVSQLEGFTLSKKVFRHIKTDEKNVIIHRLMFVI
jgi:hypothetical protein